ncbi:hypothetical protein Goklo_029129 [Gossypium klotzschianum]|uniref:Uncharacterized protein n=1 Tax=Gossypium klotzschianum TaxID=34286 RepID=A0A7J8W6D8_9ROSI|nr:hypothetical protein [Gossypium klotzschianum]MBA0670558.1 hypothetical protein [Gossypium klotzschianum]
MHARKRVRVDSLDLHCSYSHGSTGTFGRLIRFHIGSSLKIIRH